MRFPMPSVMSVRYIGVPKHISKIRESEMKDRGLELLKGIQELLLREEGQDLVEYSLVVSMIAFGGVAGMQALDAAIIQTFNTVSATFASIF
jgi:pilus assembly protein Flp/PilA